MIRNVNFTTAFLAVLILASCTQKKTHLDSNLSSEQAATSQHALASFFATFEDQDTALSIPRLHEKMQQLAGHENRVAHQLLDKGRSRQKEFITPGYPRVLLTFNRRAKPSEAGRFWAKLFFGFAELNDQMEIIAYDDQQGRYDFYVVENFSQKNAGDLAKQMPVARFECDFCHQNEGPIFSIDPWTDTNSTSEVSGAIINGLRSRGIKTDHYLSIPLSTEFGQSQEYDTATDEANELLGIQKAWQKLCPTKSLGQCRLSMLKLALASSAWRQDEWLSARANQFWKTLAKESNTTQVFDLTISSIGDELMDLNFDLPMNPESPLPKFSISVTGLIDDPLGYYHDGLSEEFSLKNGYNAGIIFSWLRRHIFDQDVHRVKDTYPGPQQFMEGVVASTNCETALAEPVFRQETLRLCSL